MRSGPLSWTRSSPRPGYDDYPGDISTTLACSRAAEALAAEPDPHESPAADSKNELDRYNERECYGSYQNVEVDGIVTDAYFCGNTQAGIDWTPVSGQADVPAAPLCSAQFGSAYLPDGVCGRLTFKEQIMNLQSLQNVTQNMVYSNTPSVSCILGLGNCDIYYCQSCFNRCNPPGVTPPPTPA